MKTILFYIVLISFGISQNITDMEDRILLLENKIQKIRTIRDSLNIVVSSHEEQLGLLKSKVLSHTIKNDTTKQYKITNPSNITKLLSNINNTPQTLSIIPKGEQFNLYNVFNGKHIKASYKNKFGYINYSYVLGNMPVELYRQFKNHQRQYDEEQRKINQEKAERKRSQAITAREHRLIKKYGKSNVQKITDRKIWIGMTKEMTLESWGEPNDINRSVGSWGVHEQWIYSSGQYLYFENGKLTSWQD